MIPEVKSAHESMWITENIINPILFHFGVVADKDVVRKVVHALEFCILSIVISLWLKKPVRSFYLGFTLTFLDESLQLISGRGALITNIWIDLIGVAVGMGIGQVISMSFRKSRGETSCK